MEEKYFVILVNYCNPQLTIDCIDSMRSAGCGMNHIIVVDNCSPDDSREVLKQVEGIHLILAEENGGFSYGNNLGIRYALEQGARYVLLLNNDTVVAADFFMQIFRNANSQQINVPKIYYYAEPNVLWYAGGTVNYRKGLQCHYGDKKQDSEKYSQECDTHYASGCCMLIPREVIESVGVLDEQFFMYWEDVDYTLRLERAGIRIHYLPEAKIWHKVGMSGGNESKMGIYYSNRNRFIILKRYHFGPTAWCYTIMTRTIKYTMSFIRKSNNRIIWRAWKDYHSGVMGKVNI